MKNKKITKRMWGELKIHNSWDIAKYGESVVRLFITCYTQGQYSSWGWAIVGIDFKTDKMDFNGNKNFSIYNKEHKTIQLQEAMDWCKKQYGITEWEQDVFGDYQIKGVIEKAYKNNKEEKCQKNKDI